MSLEPRIEIIISKINSNDVSYHTEYIEQVDNNPDDAVINHLHKLGLKNYKEYIIHSTSWRYEKTKDLILTYLVVLPTSAPFKTQQNIDIRNAEIASNDDLYKPRPRFLDSKNVIKHAFRHLAYLIKHDYKGKYHKALTQNQIKYILSVYDEIGGEFEQ